ncbi:hypothetical protein F5972_23960 [Microbispora cellulosiformans]|uniref:Uncharacterized protein n=1 Tax=Microbispora cellulosiformans TaxID=2614688 RepID=A0A5J5JZ64_9ACTN|nr:hypothetical protein [Microbispora cellulosiformans]KAA9376466.1 hypothetical protein F5972_23960 [Microbispora cellulosiformans]
MAETIPEAAMFVSSPRRRFSSGAQWTKGITMMKRTRLAVATATLAALAATGTAAAADPAPAPGAAKSESSTVKVDGRSRAGAQADLAAIAAKLGVAAERLDAALVAAKMSLAESAGVTPEAFVAAVAANLGLPVPQVQEALRPIVVEPAPGDDRRGKLDGIDKKAPDGPQNSSDKPRAGVEADLAAIAGRLGVTVERLDAALVAAKKSLAKSDGVTPEAFGAAVAAQLGLPVSQVQEALRPMIAEPAPAGADRGKLDGMDKKGGDGPQESPFTTDAAAASLAEALGVDQAKAKAALAALVALGRVDVTSKTFRDIAASLGVGSDRLDAALSDLKRSLSKG